jgi:hypothetical protein
MNYEAKESDAASSDYRGPAIVEVGDVAALTGAGGTKVTDTWSGHTATDWNKKNSDAPDDVSPDESE